MLFTYSAHQTKYEDLLKTRFILEMKFDLEMEIFKLKVVCGNFYILIMDEKVLVLCKKGGGGFYVSVCQSLAGRILDYSR